VTLGGDVNEEEIAMPAPFIVNFHMPIDAEDRGVIAVLQSMLVELIDLALIGKQAHWNVEGLTSAPCTSSSMSSSTRGGPLATRWPSAG
jgi:hypothetical protein